MTINVGDKVPSVNFKQLTSDGLVDVSTDDYCKGRKVALFSVPGAFTPTCSAQHVPSYVQNADALKAKGVAAIACVSVNDAFVMQAWGEATGAGDAVEMLADGNGEFARATGLTLDGSGFGLGERSTRFSMVIDDGTISELNVESNPSEMDVSSAEHMLGQL
ncbi:MAG: peroxiredoxin [Rhodospirillaceae bacterium]|nr:peroxiredoxin [Rhodospirillaceae bacterium]